MDRSLATYELPLLNRDEPFVPDEPRTEEDDFPIIYDTASKINQRTHISQVKFEQIYSNVMRYYADQEKHLYKKYQSGELPPSHFYQDVTVYLKRNFPVEMSNDNDYAVMMKRLNLAVFQYDVLQPLIDDPDTTDITVNGPYSIVVRIKGKTYLSNAQFIDELDMFRFIEGLSIRNKVDLWSGTSLTFSDSHDENYILRFSVSTPWVTCSGLPAFHIRKVSKTKASFDDLIKEGMLTPKIKDYLIDRAKFAKGIVFAGPPGSGKTTALNAFIEHIPKTRMSLVIQENDELFSNQANFIFKHVTHGFGEKEPICTLEDLGKIALVEGCNEFIIGEVKGGEMRNAMTLLNAGGYAALTVHSTNAYETLDKLADLVKYGSSYSFEEARRMLKTFEVIVYMEGFKIREILECTGYDEETKKYKYINIYRYGI